AGAATAWGPQHAGAAAVTFATLPGARLFHEGQLEGWRVRLPVFLARRPAEPSDAGVATFYRTLLGAIRAPALREGSWRLLETTGWPGDGTFDNLVAWTWEEDDERRALGVRLSAAPRRPRLRPSP